jgi:hypothetical protein
MIFCYLYIHVYESVNSLQRLWFVKLTNLSVVYLSMINMCVYKKNRIECYYDGYSCHMNDTTAVIRQNQDFCVGKDITIRTYAMFFCFCLLISIYTLKIHLSRWEGCYHISVRPRKVICHGFLRLRICGKRYLLII